MGNLVPFPMDSDANRETKSPQQVLRDAEARTGLRHEIQAGKLVAMAGGSIEHAALSAACSALLRDGLSRLGCKALVLSSDARMRVDHDPDGSHRYPDVSVICGDVQRHADDETAFTNPAIVVEVSSSSTAIYDRNQKREIYLGCKSLFAYLIVSQDFKHVDMVSPGGNVIPHVVGQRIGVSLGEVGTMWLSVDELYAGIL